MAKLNVQGSQMMEALSQELDFHYDRCGSLVLCMAEEDKPNLQKLYEKGVANGVQGLETIDSQRLQEMEPNVSKDAVAALWAPTGAIVCPFGLNFALAENAATNGVKFQFNTEVQEIIKTENGWRLATNNGVFETKVVVNAAGVQAGHHHLLRPACPQR